MNTGLLYLNILAWINVLADGNSHIPPGGKFVQSGEIPPGDHFPPSTLPIRREQIKIYYFSTIVSYLTQLNISKTSLHISFKMRPQHQL